MFVGVMFTLTACGSKSTTNETTDSTTTQVDTASVQLSDTTNVVDSVTAVQ